MSENRALRDSHTEVRGPEVCEKSVRDVQPSAREVITASGLLYLLRYGRFQEDTSMEESVLGEPDPAEDDILTDSEISKKTLSQTQGKKPGIKENENGSEL